MEKFPNLEPHQVAVIRAEYNTGHVLDDKYNLLINDSQVAFTIFMSIDEALKYIEDELNRRDDIEFAIFNNKQKVMFHIRSLVDFKTKFPQN